MALVLNEDWTAHVVGQMHKYRIMNIELAARCVYRVDENGDASRYPAPSYSPQYLSTVLNGNKVFESEEAAQKTQERILSALDELIAERMSEVEKSDAGNDAGPEGD